MARGQPARHGRTALIAAIAAIGLTATQATAVQAQSANASPTAHANAHPNAHADGHPNANAYRHGPASRANRPTEERLFPNVGGGWRTDSGWLDYPAARKRHGRMNGQGPGRGRLQASGG